MHHEGALSTQFQVTKGVSRFMLEIRKVRVQGEIRGHSRYGRPHPRMTA